MFVHDSAARVTQGPGRTPTMIILPWSPVQLGLRACTTRSSYRAFLAFSILVWSFLTYADTTRKMEFVESFQTDSESRIKPYCSANAVAFLVTFPATFFHVSESQLSPITTQTARPKLILAVRFLLPVIHLTERMSWAPDSREGERAVWWIGDFSTGSFATR